MASELGQSCTIRTYSGLLMESGRWGANSDSNPQFRQQRACRDSEYSLRTTSVGSLSSSINRILRIVSPHCRDTCACIMKDSWVPTAPNRSFEVRLDAPAKTLESERRTATNLITRRSILIRSFLNRQMPPARWHEERGYCSQDGCVDAGPARIPSNRHKTRGR